MLSLTTYRHSLQNGTEQCWILCRTTARVGTGLVVKKGEEGDLATWRKAAADGCEASVQPHSTVCAVWPGSDCLMAVWTAGITWNLIFPNQIQVTLVTLRLQTFFFCLFFIYKSDPVTVICGHKSETGPTFSTSAWTVTMWTNMAVWTDVVLNLRLIWFFFLF